MTVGHMYASQRKYPVLNCRTASENWASEGFDTNQLMYSVEFICSKCTYVGSYTATVRFNGDIPTPLNPSVYMSAQVLQDDPGNEIQVEVAAAEHSGYLGR